jgi:hypothetical protein
MCIVSGDKILTPPTELKGKFHRFIVVHGEWLMVDEGKTDVVRGTRYAKDAQRAYNTASTAITETIATAPNSHYWVTPMKRRATPTQWNKAIAENLPFLQFNPDPKAPRARRKTGGADVPVALVQEAQIRDQELKDVWGVYDSSRSAIAATRPRAARSRGATSRGRSSTSTSPTTWRRESSARSRSSTT